MNTLNPLEDMSSERNTRLRKVKLRLTNQTSTSYTLSGYNHTDGRTSNKYIVPSYKLIVTGVDNNGSDALITLTVDSATTPTLKKAK